MASFAELKAQLANLNRRTSKNADVWKPKDEHDVRLLKNPHSSDPFEQVSFHYNVGDEREILCPKLNFGEECEICDLADMLKAFKDEKGREKPKKEKDADWEVFKKIQATTKAYVPMVERTEEGKNLSAPAWWGLTSNQSGQILKVCTDAEWLQDCDIDPTDDERVLDAIFSTKKAYDFHVSFKKPGEKENKKTFTVIDITPSGKRPKALTGDATKDAELLKQIKPIREVFPKRDPKEITLALKKFVGGGMKVEEPKAKKEEEKYAAKSGEQAEKSGTRGVEEAFDELLAGKQ